MKSSEHRHAQTPAAPSTKGAAAVESMSAPRLSSPLSWPFVIDADHALLRTSLHQERALVYLKANPLRLFRLIGWRLLGRAHFQKKLREYTSLPVDALPVHEGMVALAHEAQAQGRTVHLCTRADDLMARHLMRRFRFNGVAMAENGTDQVRGNSRADHLKSAFPRGYIYADRSVASSAGKQASAFVGLAQPGRKAGFDAAPPVEVVLPTPGFGFKGWARALRVHQWAKNMLVFVPLVLSGHAHDPVALLQALGAFVTMCLMASGTYLMNDLFDLADDRSHWSKSKRALASGQLSIARGAGVACALVVASLTLAGALGFATLGLVLCYAAGTLGYSLWLKRRPIIDVFMLASLFTLRLGIGIAAVAVQPSAWLLVFSMFLFTSLSFAKRQTEIRRAEDKGRTDVGGRGYLVRDKELVLGLGLATGMAAIVIMALYIMNDVFSARFYSSPLFLWVFPAALSLWVCHVWLICHRGELDDDPVAFALKDSFSLFLGGIMAAAFAAGVLL